MTIEQADKQYHEYLEGHIGNVQEALELLHTLRIQFIDDNYEELKSICKNHDASKYSDEEYIPYREHFYPTCDEDKLKTEAFELACRHHIKNNKHHWDYWLDENNQLDIPDEQEYRLYCVERCCDWLAMSCQHDEPSSAWYHANKESIQMPDYGWELCDEIMSKVPEKCDFTFKGTRGELDEQELKESAYANDVTTKELDRNHVQFITFSNQDRTVNDFDNISKLFEYIRQCGGFKSFRGIQWFIMSDYKDGEFYLVRDRYHKSGWVWEDVNGNKVDAYDSPKRFKNMLESDYWKTLEPKIEDTENDRKGVEMYKEKIKGGFSRPVLVNKNGEILDGNHTMTAYQELGIKPKELYTGERSDFYKAVVQTKGDAEKAIHVMIDNGTAKLIESSSKSKKQTLVDFVNNANSDEIQSILYYLANADYIPDDTGRKGKQFILDVIKNNYVDEPSTSNQKKDNTDIEVAICNGTHKDRSEYLTEELAESFGNSGYVGQSKSVRAFAAEEEEKYPASECDKLLGVRSGATKAVLSPSEWHHTGSYYKETDYYDIRLLLAIKNNDEEVMSEYNEDEIKEAKQKYEDLKQWKKPELQSNTYKADVEWLTWSGTRKHPKAEEHKVKNTEVTERGSYYYFKDEYGIDTKKMIGSNGTRVRRIDESINSAITKGIATDVALNFGWHIENGSKKTEFLIITNKNNIQIGKIYFTYPSSISVYIFGKKQVIDVPDDFDKSNYVYEQFIDKCNQVIKGMINKEKQTKEPEKDKSKSVQLQLDLDESFKIVRGERGYLLEASMKQLKRKTLSEDPTRAKKSKHVQSKYIGISKYGVLNFETTSETHSGVTWYQEVHFPSFNGFMNIIEEGDVIEAEDVKKAMSSDNIKISCFTEDTEVQTLDGMKKIKDIKVGDKVLTHTGKYQDVLQTFENDYNGEMIEINGVKSTPNHPYLVKLPNGDIEWKMACEITKDMKLLEVEE